MVSVRFVLLVAAAALLASAATVRAHSWLGCADYRGDVSKFEKAKCYAWPRKFGQVFQYSGAPDADGYWLGSDAGYNYNGADACNKPMTNPLSDNYSPDYPMAVYEAGGTYCLAHPTKNHVAGGKCTNQYIPDTRMTIFRSSVNPTSDPDQATFKQYEVKNNYGSHVNGQVDCLGFQRSPNFCSNTGFALATGCITLEENIPLGNYVFQWYWAFNNADDRYKTCWDAKVVAKGTAAANGGTAGTGGLTGWQNLKDTLTDAGDTCLKSWTAAGLLPPTPGGVAPSYPGGTTNGGSGSGTGTGTSSGGTTAPPAKDEGGVTPSQIVWSGTLDTYGSEVSTDLDKWSWQNRKGEFQTYIHGTTPADKMSSYATLDSDYSALLDHAFVTQGVQIRTDSSSVWQGQNDKRRTELVAEMGTDLSKIQNGKKFFVFAMRQSAEFPLNKDYEHQLVFFENHMCEIKYGAGSATLQFFANGQKLYSTPWAASAQALHKSFAFEVDFSAKTIALWASDSGAKNLERVVEPVSVPGVAASDWHIGQLRLSLNNQQTGPAEAIEYSSMYVTTDIKVTPTLVLAASNLNAASALAVGAAAAAVVVAATIAML